MYHMQWRHDIWSSMPVSFVPTLSQCTVPTSLQHCRQKLLATTNRPRGCTSNFVPSLPAKCATDKRVSSSMIRISVVDCEFEEVTVRKRHTTSDRTIWTEYPGAVGARTVPLLPKYVEEVNLTLDDATITEKAGTPYVDGFWRAVKEEVQPLHHSTLDDYIHTAQWRYWSKGCDQCVAFGNMMNGTQVDARTDQTLNKRSYVGRKSGYRTSLHVV
eukprot:6421514-Amphidinium_carterae.1